MSENEEIIIDYDTLVLCGSSAKGILTIGALQYLVDNFLLKNIHTYIGTSSGLIICYLLSIGYTPIEIMVYICTHQLLEKMHNFNIVSMMNGTGACSFSYIQEQLEKMTITKIGFLPTLKDIKIKFEKTLICVTHNLTLNQTEYLSYENNPDLPCIIALKMSSNLPFVFENFKYNGNFYVDGGISDNFAIDIGDKLGKKILGITIDIEEENFNSNSNMNILEYIYKLMFIPITQSTEYKIKLASSRCKIFKLKYSDIKFFNFNINSKAKLEMFSSGYSQIKQIYEL